jgi:catechol 2,3-dioxygenase-like lactoylglutathione lyase family enzyme
MATADQRFQVIPIFRIFDVDKARAFYLDFLGMSVDWEHRFEDAAPLYMQVSRGALRLHLSEHHGDCCPGSTVYVHTTGLEDYHRKITAKGYGFMRPDIEPAPWGEKIMEVIDPFGNRIRFCGP